MSASRDNLDSVKTHTEKMAEIFQLRHPCPIPSRPSTRKCTHAPLIVTAKDLGTLLDREDCYKGKLGGTKYKVVRFLLKTDGELVFGAEGAPSGHIPAHYQMVGPVSDVGFAKCFSAGNAFFSIENNVMFGINHKSGDFRPNFDSLQFVLRKLADDHVPMHSTIRIERLNEKGAPINFYMLDGSEFQNTKLITAAPVPVSADAMTIENNNTAVGNQSVSPTQNLLITFQEQNALASEAQSSEKKIKKHKKPRLPIVDQALKLSHHGLMFKRKKNVAKQILNSPEIQKELEVLMNSTLKK